MWIETWLHLRQTDHQEVTPHVGVWIETDKHTGEVPKDSVTPHVGVWIETRLQESSQKS